MRFIYHNIFLKYITSKPLILNHIKSLLYTLAISVVLAVVGGSSVLAANKNVTTAAKSRTSLGIDVSYPQCRVALPSGQAFAIVGVNGGVATTINPCFLTQLAWTQKSTGGTGQPKAALYVNTANPGTLSAVWPTSNDTAYGVVENPYGECAGAEDAACAYVYGWSRAYEGMNRRNVPNPTSYKWWLDVETANSWSTTDLKANAATLEGTVAYFQSSGVSVDVYSTSYQWGIIVGVPSPTSNLNGLDSWLACAASQRDAQQFCTTKAGLTPTSKVVMSQFVSKNLDYNYSCI